MRRHTLLKASTTKDACIFCITRSQFAATRPFPRFHQRLLHDECGTGRSLVGRLVETRQCENNGRNWRSIPQYRRQQSSGWSSNAALRDLTPQEEALRDALKKETPRQPVIRRYEKYDGQSSERRWVTPSQRYEASQSSRNFRPQFHGTSRYEDSISNLPSDSGVGESGKSREVGSFTHKSSSSRFNENRNGDMNFGEGQRGSHLTSRATNRQNSWHQNPLKHASSVDRLRNAHPQSRILQSLDKDNQNYVERESEEERFLVQDWKHIKRRGFQQNEQSSPQAEFPRPRFSRKPEALHSARAAEEERLRRMESTKNGDFVGFHRGDERPNVNRTRENYRRLDEFTARAATDDNASLAQSRSAVPLTHPKSTENIRLSSSTSIHPKSSSKPTSTLTGWDYPVDEMSSSTSLPHLQPSGDTGSSATVPQSVQSPAFASVESDGESLADGSASDGRVDLNKVPPSQSNKLDPRRSDNPGLDRSSDRDSATTEISAKPQLVRSPDSSDYEFDDLDAAVSAYYDSHGWVDLNDVQSASLRTPDINRSDRTSADRSSSTNSTTVGTPVYQQSMRSSGFAGSENDTNRPTTTTPDRSSSRDTSIAGNSIYHQSAQAPDFAGFDPDGSVTSSSTLSVQFDRVDKFIPRQPRSKQTDYYIDEPDASLVRPNRLDSLDSRQSNMKGLGSGVESTSMPYGQSRYKQRRQSRRIFSEDDLDGFADDEGGETKQERNGRRRRKEAAKKATAAPRVVPIPEHIKIPDLKTLLKIDYEELLPTLKDLGFNNHFTLNAEEAGLVAAAFNCEPATEQDPAEDLLSMPPLRDSSSSPPRPPVVTIMGHVDHGKTTLLDYLRKTSVAASEHGGITQHIGAFTVRMPAGNLITFLDTPGHEAFLAMRKRGADVTDTVVLVVAADDSVKPQTIEAIQHAQDAKVDLIVAINKIDKGESNVERVKQDLARYGVEIEEFEGDTQVVCVSGKTGQGMQDLIDAIDVSAETLDLRAPVEGPADGWVLEATTKKAGYFATVLVRQGTLKARDYLVAGTSWTRIRSLRNEAGAVVHAASPGTAVETDGWRTPLVAGAEVVQAANELTAKHVVDQRIRRLEREKMVTDAVAINESRRLVDERRRQMDEITDVASSGPAKPRQNANNQLQASITEPQQIECVVKADVAGSAEAIENLLSPLGNAAACLNVWNAGYTAVCKTDIDHAGINGGFVAAFNVPISAEVQRYADEEGVKIISESIVYRLADAVKAHLGSKLPPVVTQRVVGEAEIAKIFEINVSGRKMVPVAGCKVRNGSINRGAKVRVVREKKEVFDGSLASLKVSKKDVPIVRKGSECGMSFDGWANPAVGDQVKAYEEETRAQSL